MERYSTYSGTALHFAAKNDRPGAVALLVRHGADLESRDSANMTPILIACRDRKFIAARRLIQLGADVNAVDSGDYAPINYAARFGDIESIRALLQAGAEIDNVARLTQRTALMEALAQRHVKTAWLLFRRGARLDMVDLNGHSPLDMARRANFTILAFRIRIRQI